MRKVPIEKIIADCNKSIKLSNDGSYLTRRDESIKTYLEELIRLRADHDRLNNFETSQCALLLKRVGELEAAMKGAKHIADVCGQRIRELEAEKDELASLVYNCTNILDKNMPVGIAERVGATGTVYQLLKTHQAKHKKVRTNDLD